MGVPAQSGPGADPAEVADTYKGDQGAKYFEYQRGIGTMVGRLNARMFEPFLEPDDVVLDFGCGAGSLLNALDTARKIGIEPNDSARRECLAAGLECLASPTEVPDASVDVVITNHVLEHVPYPIGALRELRRILKPSGKLLICVPIDDWRAQRRFDERDPNHHLQTWTPLLLGNTLHEAGFRFDRGDIRVVTEAWPPRIETLERILPGRVLNVTMRLWSMLRNRRQILAIATPISNLP